MALIGPRSHWRNDRGLPFFMWLVASSVSPQAGGMTGPLRVGVIGTPGLCAK